MRNATIVRNVDVDYDCEIGIRRFNNASMRDWRRNYCKDNSITGLITRSMSTAELTIGMVSGSSRLKFILPFLEWSLNYNFVFVI